jgi:two-component system C4-dicarboxylate transport sensor histidine kinase DctB
MNRFTRRVPFLLQALVLLLLCLALIIGAGRWTRTLELTRITNKATKALKVYTGDLQSELDKFEALPQILAPNPLFADLLLHPDDPDRQHRVNMELERINRLAETSAVYILNPAGRVLVSSNWRGAVSFVGEDLSFRPYFQQAAEGKPGRYFALGTTSHVRGYYFSAPISRKKNLLGVLTVKVQLMRLEDIWARGSERVIVTDPQGVIFITSYAPWKFRALFPLSRKVKQQLRKSRRYGDIEPDSLTGTAISLRPQSGAILMLKQDALPGNDAGTSTRHPYLIQSRSMPDAGWTVHILSDLSHVDDYVRNVMLLVAASLIALVLVGALIQNRRKTRLERLQLEERSKRLLKEANEQLEDKVRRRTRELTLINQRLQEEIEEHKQTEQELRTTQNELVQAGKLAAIGQMAASITHEINQPLSAIRMYADNACVFLAHGQTDAAAENLHDIACMIDKMAEITRHLKSFARKSPGKSTATSLAEPIANALALLDLRMKKHNITLSWVPPDEIPLAMAGSIRLEQVLVNVLANSIDAVREREDGKIWLEVVPGAEHVEIVVRDNGPGIADEHLDQLFDPFFTTKEEGKGLGLGLSLSLSIIKEFHGTIQACNQPGGGTEVRIQLLRAAQFPKEKTDG